MPVEDLLAGIGGGLKGGVDAFSWMKDTRDRDEYRRDIREDREERRRMLKETADAKRKEREAAVQFTEGLRKKLGPDHPIVMAAESSLGGFNFKPSDFEALDETAKLRPQAGAMLDFLGPYAELSDDQASLAQRGGLGYRVENPTLASTALSGVATEDDGAPSISALTQTPQAARRASVRSSAEQRASAEAKAAKGQARASLVKAYPHLGPVVGAQDAGVTGVKSDDLVPPDVRRQNELRDYEAKARINAKYPSNPPAPEKTDDAALPNGVKQWLATLPTKHRGDYGTALKDFQSGMAQQMEAHPRVDPVTARRAFDAMFQKPQKESEFDAIFNVAGASPPGAIPVTPKQPVTPPASEPRVQPAAPEAKTQRLAELATQAKNVLTQYHAENDPAKKQALATQLRRLRQQIDTARGK